MEPKNFQEMFQAAAKKHAEEAAAKILDVQIRVVTASYNQAMAYTNLILLGGYAGFFGLWQLTKEHLTKGQTLWSALLVLISLVAFILFEVYKMIFVTRLILRQRNVLQSPEAQSNPDKALAALKRLEASFEHSLGPMLFIWIADVVVCVAAGLAGTGVLAYAFIHALAQ